MTHLKKLLSAICVLSVLSASALADDSEHAKLKREVYELRQEMDALHGQAAMRRIRERDQSESTGAQRMRAD